MPWINAGATTTAASVVFLSTRGAIAQSPLGALGGFPQSSFGAFGQQPLPSGTDFGPWNSQVTLHRAFQYADISLNLIEKATNIPPEACRQKCIDDAKCIAWEVCAPLGDGCDGCYRMAKKPRRGFVEKQGWHAEIFESRAAELPEDPGLGKLTVESCENFLLEANGADQNQPFHEPENLKRYTDCGLLLRDTVQPRKVKVLGRHSPTLLITDFWDPQLEIPEEVEQEMLANSRRQPRAPKPVPQTPEVTAQLHGQMGTTSWETGQKRRGQHAFVLPFFDTNIGHWIKQHGSMNPLQSYEMQSLLQPGDVVVDVGANLGCYTLPLAERVGPHGKVLAFEPFRWMQQLVTANVALNGLTNVWVLPVGLGRETTRFNAQPPQLQFFSSPGGVKLQGQQEGLKQEETLQLYNWDSPPEIVTTVRLDEVVAQSPNVALLGPPIIDDIRLIKIDVEGMEKEVIEGARATIMRFRPIIWSENVGYFSSNGQDISFLQLMADLEYECSKAQNAPNDVVCTDKHGRGHQISV